jgi:4'-phosphopantetheinyl transferase
LRFSYSYYGKPALTTGLGHDTLNFNMSHSNEMAIYGVVRNRQIGVDIERIQTDFACEEIAARIFSPQENATLRSLPPRMKHEAFFNCWTRKEAFIKAKGLGLAYPLNQFEVSLIPGEPARLISIEEDLFEATRWSLLELEPDPDYAAALAVEGEDDWQLKCWQWTE